MMLRRLDESEKQRVRLNGSALEFRMVLHADKEIAVGQLHGLDQFPVRGNAGKRQAAFLKFLPVIIVEFVSVPVALFDIDLTISLISLCTFNDFTII